MVDVPNPPVDNNELDRIALEGDEKKTRRKPNGHAHDARPIPLPTLVGAILAGKQRPRVYLDGGQIFPNKNVALFTGDGAVGKSLLILQLALACTTGTQWLGMDVAQGPVIYYSCEDDIEEITNRLNEIAEAEGINLAEAFELHIIDMTGKDAVLGQEDHGRIRPTPTFHSLRATIDSIRPVFIGLDNLADVYAGNENDRSQAKQFITLLRGLCIDFDTIVGLLGHPSVMGMSSGSGTSGSTAWNNSVRVRPYLTKPTGADADKNARIFEVMKANYAQPGTRMELKWEAGRFVRTTPVSVFERITLDDVDRVKLKFSGENWRVHEQAATWGGYAVAEILGWDVGRFVAGAKERSTEQNRNRNDIRKYLAAWLMNGAIFAVEGRTAKREITQFYSNKPAPK